MANTVTGPTTQYDYDKKLIVYCSVLSDGSASSTTLVDVSALNQSANKETCTHVALNKIWYTVSGAPDAPASLDWDATTDVTFLTLAYDNTFDFSSIGEMSIRCGASF